MIDWNNNGKIDPADMALTMMLLDDNEKGQHSNKPPSSNSGCLSVVLIGIMVVALFVWLLV